MFYLLFMCYITKMGMMHKNIYVKFNLKINPYTIKNMQSLVY